LTSGIPEKSTGVIVCQKPWDSESVLMKDRSQKSEEKLGEYSPVVRQPTDKGTPFVPAAHGY
jgi:hypothetical protein